MRQGACAIGIDIGGTKIAAGIVDVDLRVIARAEAPTPARIGGAHIVGTAARLARELGRDRDVAVVGVGSAGVIDSRARRVVSATDHLSHWAGTELGMLLESDLGLPVTVDNDVHAHAVGEAQQGAGQGRRVVLVAAVGTGIGGAVVIDGVPQVGAHGVGGHVGHVPVPEAEGLACPCGRVGHVEGLSSGPALHALYLRRGGERSVRNAVEVVARLDTDPIAREAVSRSAAGLGRALGGLVNVLDPDAVIIAGGMRNAGPFWWSSVETALRAATIPHISDVPLLPALLGDDAAIIGAASRAFAAKASAS